MLTVYHPTQHTKCRVQIVMSVSDFHPQEVDSRKLPLFVACTQQNVYQRVHEDVVDIVATSVHIDVQIGATTKHSLLPRQHRCNDCARQITPRWDICQRPEKSRDVYLR